MKRLVINEPGTFLSARKGMIVVKKKGEKILEVSPSNIGQVVVLTRGASMSSAAVTLLARHNVDIVFYSGGYPEAKLSSFTGKGTVALRKAQYSAQGKPSGAYLAKRFSWAKVVNQKALLREAGKNRPRLSATLLELSREEAKIAEEILSLEGSCADDVRGEIMKLEAEAAKIYWEGFKLILPEDAGFPGRKKRFEMPDDPVNVMLNFCYSLLSMEVWLAVESAGLDAYAGFLHADSPRRPALVMDAMEEFRQPVVDRAVLRLAWSTKNLHSTVENGMLKRDARFAAVKAVSERLSEQVSFLGRRLPFHSHIFLQARRIADYLLSRTRDYKPFTMR